MHRPDAFKPAFHEMPKPLRQRELERNGAFAQAFSGPCPVGKNLGFSPVAKVIPPVVTLFTAHGIAINLSFTKTACRVRTGVKISRHQTLFINYKLLETP